jgi:hypothetical protein
MGGREKNTKIPVPFPFFPGPCLKREKKKKKKKNVVVMKTVVADAQVCLANRADIGADGSFTGPDG